MTGRRRLEKLVYIIFKKPEDSAEACAGALLESAAPKILAADAAGLTIEIADLADDSRVRSTHLTGDGAAIAAAVSVWLRSVDERGAIEEALAGIGVDRAGYLVTESTVQEYARRDWPDGERSPGVTQFVTFPQPNDLSDEAFFSRWHGQVTPMSFDLHPTRTRYIRNVTSRALTPDAPRWRGIVSERWNSLEEWLDPSQLYSSMALFERMQAVGFADPQSVQLTLMSEWILRSRER